MIGVVAFRGVMRVSFSTGHDWIASDMLKTYPTTGLRAELDIRYAVCLGSFLQFSSKVLHDERHLPLPRVRSFRRSSGTI